MTSVVEVDDRHPSGRKVRSDARRDSPIDDRYREVCEHSKPCGCDTATTYQNKVSCCINCPFTECVFVADRKTGRSHPKSVARQRRVVTLCKEGISPHIIAQVVGISKRSVFRLLKQDREDRACLFDLLQLE